MAPEEPGNEQDSFNAEHELIKKLIDAASRLVMTETAKISHIDEMVDGLHNKSDTMLVLLQEINSMQREIKSMQREIHSSVVANPVNPRASIARQKVGAKPTQEKIGSSANLVRAASHPLEGPGTRRKEHEMLLKGDRVVILPRFTADKPSRQIYIGKEGIVIDSTPCFVWIKFKDGVMFKRSREYVRKVLPEQVSEPHA